eukprot:TRINITY_DN14673_c0_g1_i1.p1 TRINITY_DN14673_c0_g1~~TRINITY_DN14673_c0_g1_i1.p1  ORF type:complete len:182 (-),score=40.72 TRINITY_DN14673_c0_g1_i1:57-602(-)
MSMEETDCSYQKVPIYKRPIDLFICLLLVYYCFSCFFIERHYCDAELDPHSENSILQATYEYSEKYNPLFLSRPLWLQIATCISAYGLGSFYLVAFVSFFLGLDSLRVPLLCGLSFKTYAITLYYLVEFLGDLPPPHYLMFLAADGPYIIGIILLFIRLVPNPKPFSKLVMSRKPINKKKL